MAREAYTLKTLSEMHGGGDNGYEEALRLYALSNQTARQNPEVHSANKKAAEQNMLGFTIDGVPHSRDINSATDWADFGQSCNRFVASDFAHLWTTLLDAGLDPQQAQSYVNSCARQSYETYHFGVFPKSAHYNIGTDNDAYWFKQALDSFVYQTNEGGSTLDYEGTTIGYNPTTHIFTFTSNSMGRTRQVTISQLHKEAWSLYEGRSTNTSTDDSLDIDNINAQRNDPYSYIVDRGID